MIYITNTTYIGLKNAGLNTSQRWVKYGQTIVFFFIIVFLPSGWVNSKKVGLNVKPNRSVKTTQ